MRVDRLDHLVLTGADIGATVAFSGDVLGTQAVTAERCHAIQTLGTVRFVHLRDPDRNLVEIAVYEAAARKD